MARKVLICDDEPAILDLVRALLERAGYQVVTAADGRAALLQAWQERPDLIILDVMMPYVDGFGVLQTLRRDAATRDVPVILLTARTSDADTARGWNQGADAYLTKPFNPDELVMFVKRIFESLPGADGTVA